MGRSTNTAKVKFYSYLSVDIYNKFEFYDDCEDENDVVENGWKLSDDCERYGEGNFVVYVKKITKDNKTVYLINEAFYDTDYDITVFSDNLNDLQEFLTDQKLKEKIETDGIVKQTL